jgi:penicillin-insensitive murein DD-endopeptidase
MRVHAILAALASLVAVPAILAAQNAAPKPATTRPQAKAAAQPVVAKKAPSKATAAKEPPKPAKELFGAAKTPASMAARSIGFYAKGCLAGAAALPVDGPAWQAMRLSRNRNWGHLELISLVEKFAQDAKKHDGWPGLLVGDISQPRGGPMLTGHASHQVGLDADIWFTPMPDRRLSTKEREELSATSMLAEDNASVNPQVWTETHVKLLKRIASYKQVERVLVNPAIKKAVCVSETAKADRSWLRKVRPIVGHYYHFHIRIACPNGSAGCEGQASPPEDDGCGPDLDAWLERIRNAPKIAPRPPGPPPRPKPPMTMAQLPADCRAVLASGDAPAASRLKQAGAAAKKATTK